MSRLIRTSAGTEPGQLVVASRPIFVVEGAAAANAAAETANVTVVAHDATGGLRNVAAEVAGVTVVTAGDAAISVRPSDAAVTVASGDITGGTRNVASQHAAVTAAGQTTTSTITTSGGVANVNAVANNATVDTGSDPNADPGVALIAVSTASSTAVLAYARNP